MRLLLNNLSRVYYSNLDGTIDIVDEDGWDTGEVEKAYTEPTELYCNVSAATGNAQTNTFGVTENYDYILLIAGECPFTETSILWIGKTPMDGDSNAIVKRIAQTRNYTKVAVKRVDVSDGLES